MCGGIVIIQFHQSENHSSFVQSYSPSKAKPSSANKFKITFCQALRVKPERVNREEKYIIIPSLFMKDRVASAKITPFTYKTFKCNELLKCRRCCKWDTFALFLLVRKNLLFFLSIYAPAPILFSLCVHSMEGDSSRTQISPWGMKRWQRCMQRPLLFLRATERETLAPLTGKMWHFLLCDTLHLQIDALSEIDRRRRNECASVTQRHATRTLLDLSFGAFWLVCFLKHAGPAVYVIQIYSGWRKCVSIYCSGG